MTYYADLSPCLYFGANTADKLIAVGWLEGDQNYTQGEVGDEFLDKLIELLVKPWMPMYFMGAHDCSLCNPSEVTYELTYKGITIQTGTNNLFVPADGFLYVAPSSIAHYILVHRYAPPTQFCEAIIECPPMLSSQYLEAVRKNAPKKFADRIKT